MMQHSVFALLDRVTALAASRDATAAGAAARLALAPDRLAFTAPAWAGVPALPGAAYVRVRATVRGAIDVIELELDAGAGPTRAELEGALGLGREQPPVPGAGGPRLAFARPGDAGHVPLSLFADVDGATGRVRALIVRRDVALGAC